jgi:hypothetical protein
MNGGRLCDPQRPALASIEPGLRERGAGAGKVIGGNHDLHAPEGRVSKLDVDVGFSKLPGQVAEGAGPVLDIHHEHFALVGDPHPGALERLPAPGNGLVVKEQVNDAPALAGERRKAADTDAGFASDLCQPGKLSRLVFENHRQIRGHRTFDLAMRPAPGILIAAGDRPAWQLTILPRRAGGHGKPFCRGQDARHCR